MNSDQILILKKRASALEVIFDYDSRKKLVIEKEKISSNPEFLGR